MRNDTANELALYCHWVAEREIQQASRITHGRFAVELGRVTDALAAARKAIERKEE
jgi:hypothetical protein